MIDEICRKYDGMVDWFDEQRSYNQYLMEKDWLESMVHALPAVAHILDLGCGTGEPLAGYFIRQGYQITGVDGSPRMIEKCRARFPAMNWMVSRIQDYRPEQQFDAVIAWDSTFHLPPDDQRAMIPMFSSAVRPGGYLLFTSGPEAGEITGEMNGAEFYYASLAPVEYRQLLERHGFHVVRHVIEDESCGKHTVWLAFKAAL